MPITLTRRTPGVYITELAAFPPSVVGVQTAVPAFIGYTERAALNGQPIFLQPTLIGSMADFELLFGTGPNPEYDIVEASTSEGDADSYDFTVTDPESTVHYYKLVPTSPSWFFLYRSMQLFYANGGGSCYVVSVGTYADGATIGKEALIKGLDAIGDQAGPTMLVIPDAVLLDSNADFATVSRSMLAQCKILGDRVAILDVYDTENVTPTSPGRETTTPMTLEEVLAQFWEDVGEESLSYGMAYFPFLVASVFQLSEIRYTNIAASSFGKLQEILLWQNAELYGEGSAAGISVAANILRIGTSTDVVKLNNNLTAALPLLADIEQDILTLNQMLPPSAAMAGVYTQVDSTQGVWNAPANVVLNAVTAPTFNVNDGKQANMNLPINGKAVNAIRYFTGRGPVVWGARTLDGNSNDYRYIQVRRTLNYIEQSIKAALNPYVFAANNGGTWTTVIAMVSSFLQGVWSQGGLLGASASEAYTVQCGLGSTMTGQDILEGYMIVQVTLQMIRPAEFIELTFKQTMEGVG